MNTFEAQLDLKTLDDNRDKTMTCIENNNEREEEQSLEQTMRFEEEEEEVGPSPGKSPECEGDFGEGGTTSAGEQYDDENSPILDASMANSTDFTQQSPLKRRFARGVSMALPIAASYSRSFSVAEEVHGQGGSDRGELVEGGSDRGELVEQVMEDVDETKDEDARKDSTAKEAALVSSAGSADEHQKQVDTQQQESNGQDDAQDEGEQNITAGSVETSSSSSSAFLPPSKLAKPTPRRYGKAAATPKAKAKAPLPSSLSSTSSTQTGSSASAKSNNKEETLAGRARSLVSGLIRRLFGAKRHSSVSRHLGLYRAWSSSSSAGPRRSPRLQRSLAAAIATADQLEARSNSLTARRLSRALSAARTPARPRPASAKVDKSKGKAPKPGRMEGLEAGCAEGSRRQLKKGRKEVSFATREAAMTLLAVADAREGYQSASGPDQAEEEQVQVVPVATGSKGGGRAVKRRARGAGGGEASKKRGNLKKVPVRGPGGICKGGQTKVTRRGQGHMGKVTRWTTLAARVKGEMPKLRPISRTKARAFARV